VETAGIEPYRIRALRRAVDGCAFRVYHHWVKRGELQNRAALFENRPKQELKLAFQQSLEAKQKAAPGL
jgi:phosphorylase kinase gamma subunit